MVRAEDFLPDARPAFRRRALLTFQRLAYWSGLGSAFLRATGTRGAVILMYHSVAGPRDARFIDPRNRLSPELFERQMAFLARHRRVVPMEELLEAHRAGRSLPRGSVVVTFDDGYRDNLEVAAPILDSFGHPALLYLPTALVARGESPWSDELYTLFRSRRAELEPVELRGTYADASGRLVLATPEERRRILAETAARLDSAERAPRLTLDWDEVRTLRERHPHFAVGVHSANHVDLTAHGEEVLRAEIRQCVEDLERELGSPPRHFAYPYNRRNETTDRELQASALASAVTAGKEILVTGDNDPLRLPRVDVPRSDTLFRYWTSGAHPGLTLKILGRA